MATAGRGQAVLETSVLVNFLKIDRAVKRARRFRASIAIENTESLMVSLIRAGVLNLSAADAIKQDWERNHRFRLPFSSFSDRI